jgi:NRAMP (natural resistance-associated macrophage protein)-like metal ion transporter
VGPGLITACVVIGPGSILTSSQVGAAYGYRMSWVVLLAAVLMLVFMTLGAKLGVVTGRSTGDLVAQRAGRWLAALIGCSVFFISASFQFGNNLGVVSAFAEFEPQLKQLPFLHLDYLLDYIIVAFNLLAILFLFVFHNLYRFIERLMMLLVAVMLLSFTINLFFARPSLIELLQGFVPSVAALGQHAGSGESATLALLALVGTTFVITAAYFQSYLVRQKGWTADDVSDGMMDVRVGVVIMGLITLMLMSTAGAELRGQTLNSLADVAAGLKPAFGVRGHALFCLGLFAAAYSSFLVNSMIGGFILADGLGLGSKPSDLAPRLLTVAVLLTGMIVALLVSHAGLNRVLAIVSAQAVTVVAAPLVAGALLWLTSRRDVMGDQRNGPVLNVLSLLGFGMLLVMAWYTALYKVWPQLSALMGVA